MIYIRRQLQDSILQLSQEYPVLMLTGPRQVGKTTLLMELTKESPRGYVSLDDLNARAMARDDPSLFLQIHRPPLLIDEAQYAIEIKRSAHPDRRMTSAFSLLDRPPLRRGTGAVLCLSEDLGALDERTLIVPIEYV